MSLITKLFPRLEANKIYVRFHFDKIELSNLTTQKKSTVISEVPFSEKEDLLNDFALAESTLRKAIKECSTHPHKTVQPSLLAVVQPMLIDQRELSENEIQKLKDATAHAGAKEVKVFLGSEVLDEKEILVLLEAQN